jgi:hypothetical protein
MREAVKAFSPTTLTHLYYVNYNRLEIVGSQKTVLEKNLY